MNKELKWFARLLFWLTIACLAIAFVLGIVGCAAVKKPMMKVDEGKERDGIVVEIHSRGEMVVEFEEKGVIVP